MADSRDFPKDWADEMNDEQVSKSRATVSICNRCHHALSQHEFNACYVKGCLCEGLIAAAPAPQAEGTHSKKCLDQLYSSLNASCICGLDGLKVGAAPAETVRGAKAIFTVHVSCGIGLYKGDWTGNEQKYERQNAVVLETENQAEAEALYERLSHFSGETAGPYKMDVAAIKEREMDAMVRHMDYRK